MNTSGLMGCEVDWVAVMFCNRAMVCCLTCPTGATLSADSVIWCHARTWMKCDFGVGCLQLTNNPASDYNSDFITEGFCLDSWIGNVGPSVHQCGPEWLWWSPNFTLLHLHLLNGLASNTSWLADDESHWLWWFPDARTRHQKCLSDGCMAS